MLINLSPRRLLKDEIVPPKQLHYMQLTKRGKYYPRTNRSNLTECCNFYVYGTNFMEQ